eukprot:TRINITY_DN21559_c0_g1_i1.p1 TRINITY_DN21559_c0_g1~~TRINITY_DN21559_c0_g1_i1.p1  ORF type:complete len:493 (-),score=121.86 TRINITY_DN21559_c0_g1_i1:164-1525(-)
MGFFGKMLRKAAGRTSGGHSAGASHLSAAEIEEFEEEEIEGPPTPRQEVARPVVQQPAISTEYYDYLMEDVIEWLKKSALVHDMEPSDAEMVRMLLCEDLELRSIATKKNSRKNPEFDRVMADKDEFYNLVGPFTKAWPRVVAERLAQERKEEEEEEARQLKRLEKQGVVVLPKQGDLQKQLSEASSYEETIEDVTEEEHAKLMATVRRLQPAIVLPSELVTDAEMDARIKARMNPLRKFNSSLIQMDNTRTFGASPVPPPATVIVTGHNPSWGGGNLGVNGIYERYPSDYQGCPVYQKTLEKRAVATIPPPGTRIKYKDLHDHQWMDRFQNSMRNQVVKSIPRPEEDFREMAMCPTYGTYFLYYKNDLGAWCIGPKVGGHEIFAKCNDVEEGVPFNMMSGWQVWDAGTHKFRPSVGMRAVKAGTAESHSMATLPPWRPPRNWPRAQLPNDQW